ncbi:lantibiotic dehydratase [Streptomyces sp. NPDC093065]|uniref:lantibiotic dehydratase n=1 Tax=Streptomyces sp. NPDC093065 TaxID=3366021 RepID=UPI003812791F
MTKESKATLPIAGSAWGLWPTAMVRGAGFPADAVRRLADERLAQLADQGAEDSEYRLAFDESAERTSHELAEVARSERFRLAVGWQNARFLDTAVEPFLRQRDEGKPSNSKRRSRERAIATYWQRYCLKNESIGFFGPTAWASIGDDDTALHAASGPEQVAEGTVYLERWAVDTLARTLTAEYDVRPWLRPRRSPLLRLDGDTVRLADGTITAVDQLTRTVLAAADGTRSARDLARLLTDEQEAFELFDRLRRKRWLIWRLELPTSLTAEEDLLALFTAIDDEEIRARTTGRITELIEGRQRLQAVWDKPDELRREMDRLEEVFQRLTGAHGTRNAGQAYGGRTLAYLECRRDLAVQIGSEFTDALRPVTGVLDSIRWLTWHIRQRLEPGVRKAYRAAFEKNPVVDVASFWVECMPLLGGEIDTVVRETMTEFHRRWADIVADTGTVTTMTELEPRLKEQFDAPGPGWTQARLSCPDVMVAASSQEDIRKGRYTVVLGEIHAAMNSIDYISMVPSQLNPGLLAAGLDDSFPMPRLLPVLPTESRPHFTVRSHPGLMRDDDRRIAVMPQTPLPQRGTTVLAADARVEERDGRLVVTTPGHEGHHDVFDLFGETLKALLLRHFGLFPVQEHRSRITVDGTILAREAWRVPAEELTFAGLPDEAQRFTAARRWATALGLPRHVFVKSPGETKPFYVDFAAPVLVELLASSVRSTTRAQEAAALTFVEMTPGPEELWLTDANGDHYTSELRFAALDLRSKNLS